MTPIIVLVTDGKHESVDSASVRLFENKTDAEAFIALTCSGPKKYWTHAEIVEVGEVIEIHQPEGDY